MNETSDAVSSAPSFAVQEAAGADCRPQFVGPMQGAQQRRARSEILELRISEELDLRSGDGAEPVSTTGSFDEVGAMGDLFSTFKDMEKRFATRLDGSRCYSDYRAAVISGGREERSNSVERVAMVAGPALETAAVLGEVMETKKAMSAEQVAELAIADPKRAKRILANRQSAARSKERKARYIVELEQKVRNLQTEATSLSAQLQLFQRDTIVLSSENTELKLQLQDMEREARLYDILTVELKKEVGRLKTATGEVSGSNAAAYCTDLQPPPLPNSSTFVLPHHHYSSWLEAHNRSDVPSRQFLPHPNTLPGAMPLLRRRPQGLDIGTGSSTMKSESTSTF